MVEERAIPAPSVGFFTIVSIFILVTVILATGGIYFYKINLAKGITEKADQLDKAQGRFEPAKITQLKLLDRRLKAADEILSNHVAVTPIFSALSAITMKTVRYTKFGYDLGTGKNAKVTVKMSGMAVGYRSIALQSDLFSQKDEGKNFIDPVFSNLTLDDKGNVLFDLEFSVDPSFVNYKQKLLTEQS